MKNLVFSLTSYTHFKCSVAVWGSGLLHERLLIWRISVIAESSAGQDGPGRKLTGHGVPGHGMVERREVGHLVRPGLSSWDCHLKLCDFGQTA